MTAGASFTRILVDTQTGTVHPIYRAYAGAYYQWDNGIQLTSKIGAQTFRGASVGKLVNIKPTTQPYVGIELAKLDDNDNQLLAVSLVVGWTPKPAFQLGLSTPLYAVRH